MANGEYGRTSRSLIPTRYSLLATRYSLLATRYSLLAIRYSPFAARKSERRGITAPFVEPKGGTQPLRISGGGGGGGSPNIQRTPSLMSCEVKSLNWNGVPLTMVTPSNELVGPVVASPILR
jgi:hypothetical protein